MTILFGFPGAGAGVHVFRIWKEKLGNAIDFQEIAYNKTYGSSYLENIKDAAEQSATQVLSYNSNEDEILKLCREFANTNFESIDKMLRDNEFYKESYYKD